MISALHLKNFKCHVDLKLELAPLTLLSGFNAGGKSSAYQGALLLAQAFKAGQLGPRISVNGPLVRLGTSSEVFSARSADARLLSIGITAGRRTSWWHLAPSDNDDTALRIQDIDTSSKTLESEKLPIRPIADRSKQALDGLKSIIFISAVRGTSVEVFSSPDVIDPAFGDVGPCGELAAFWFNRLSDENVDEPRLHRKQKARTLRRQLSAWGSELFPEFEVASSDLAGTGLIQLLMRNNILDPYRRPSNLGYGLSYAFPILVAALVTKPNQTLIVDSPEAHLHPRAQSNMGRFLAAMAAGGANIIVETHSDHVLNGIRVAVKDKIIAGAKASIAFFGLN